MPFGKNTCYKRGKEREKHKLKKKKVRPHTYTSVTAVVVHAGEL